MSNQITSIGLHLSALETVKALFLATFTRPLEERFLNFTLDVANSRMTISAKTESQEGESSLYRGVAQFLYVKASLNVVVPHPLAVEFPYPMTFRQLRSQLLTRYNFLVEEGELALSANGPGLLDDTLISQPLASEYVQLRLYATVTSGRFTAGSSMGLIVLQPQRRVPLTALVDVNAPDVLNVLAAK